MAGTTDLNTGPAVRHPLFLESLLRATARGRGLGRLMVVTDFSLRSELALTRALRLPLGAGASLTLLHVAPVVPGEGAPGDTQLEGRCLRRVAGTARRRLRGHEPVVVVREELCTGEVAEQATRLARSLEMELVVAGRPLVTRGREGGRGATVRRLVSELESPLLVVGPHPTRPYQRPMVVVDLSDESRRVLELALRLCPAPVGVDVLHVPEACAQGGLWREGMTALGHWLEVRQELETAARKAVNRFVAPYREVGRQFDIQIRCGGEPLEEAFLLESAGRGADLLALGLGAPDGRLRSQALAEGLVMRAGCDVLVARTPRGESGGSEAPVGGLG